MLKSISRIFLIYFMIQVNCHSLTSQTKEGVRVIHVFVSLCDNENQGIVPVPAKIGNGKDAFNNLYWGAAYGVKTYFNKKSDRWKLIKTEKQVSSDVIERVIFKHVDSNAYLVADAYYGIEIEQCIKDFLKSSYGNFQSVITVDSTQLKIGGGANLIAYVGHNGLMDFNIYDTFKPIKDNYKDVMILACYSKSFFENLMKSAHVNPLVWSNGLMSPEAYTLSWAIDGWLLGESNEQIVGRARRAYNEYQKCGMRGASNLLTTGY